VALHYLKQTRNLSDEDAVEGWVENPYRQYLSGMKYFEYELPIHPSSMTRRHERIGEAGAEDLLKETISAGLKLQVVKPYQLKRVNVDTTVQAKELRFPADARLYDRARQRLVKCARERDIRLRQYYNRVCPQLLARQSRYAHVRQMRRARGCTRRLRTLSGRVIRDIERKYPERDEAMAELLVISKRIHQQQRQDKGKVFSVYAQEVECISKGKARKRYAFGCKVSVAAASKGGWFVGAQALHGNPYDGHPLEEALEQIERIVQPPERMFVDMGCRGHGYTDDVAVHVDKRRRGGTARRLWRWMKAPGGD